MSKILLARNASITPFGKASIEAFLRYTFAAACARQWFDQNADADNQTDSRACRRI